MNARGARWLPMLALAALVVAAYSRTFSVPPLMDDGVAIVHNPSIRQLGALGSVLRPPAQSTTAGRPLLNLSFALNYAAGGIAPWGYHAFNLAVHVLAALLVYGIVRRVAPRVAWLAAALWALDPLQTESVTYLSQRAESMMGLFYLLALFTTESSPWVSVAAGYAAILTKETAVTAPVVILLYDGAFVSAGLRAALRRRPGYYGALAAMWLWLPFTVPSLGQRGIGLDAGVNWWQYFRTEWEVVARYLGLGFWPHPLVFDYGPWVDSVGRALPFGALLLVLLAAAVYAWRRQPRWAFGPVAFFILLAPTSSVVPVASQPMAESRLYLPLAALLLPLAAGIGWRWRRAGLGLLVVAVAAAMAATWARNQTYRDPAALWSEAALHRPMDYRAHDNLAVALEHADRFADALQEEQIAYRLRPTDPDVDADLGETLVNAGHPREALPLLLAAEKRTPDYAGVHYNLGRAWAAAGRNDDAIREYREALRLEPGSTRVHNNLGLALQAAGRLNEAEPEFQLALSGPQDRPADTAVIHYDYGLLLLTGGRWDQAAAQFRAALALRPDLADAWRNLGVVFAHFNRWPEAVEAFRSECRYAPRDPAAHRNLSVALSRAGQAAEAHAELDAASLLQSQNR